VYHHTHLFSNLHSFHRSSFPGKWAAVAPFCLQCHQWLSWSSFYIQKGPRWGQKVSIYTWSYWVFLLIFRIFLLQKYLGLFRIQTFTVNK
jgi:hypothetical protein